MNDEIKKWKEKTKGIFHIVRYNKFWDYINTLEQDNQMYAQLKDEYEEEIEQLTNQIIIMEKYLELIHDLGYDYDGFNYEKDLKGLIDEMCRYASLGRVCNTTEPIFVDRDKEYNILNEEIGAKNESK